MNVSTVDDPNVWDKAGQAGDDVNEHCRANIIIWLKGSVDQVKRESLIEDLMLSEGVARVHFSPARAHTLHVEYRYDVIDCDTILQLVREIHAEARVVSY